jgi:ketosteroid isomerase-like protein
MPSANLDLVRSLYPVWERADWSSVDWAHPEIEFVIADGPSPGSWTGVAEMAKAWRDFLRTWEDPRVEATEYRELDHERVLVLFHHGGRGKRSGLQLGQFGAQGATLYHVREGKVTKLVTYFDCERALADLGLAPEADAVDLETRRSLD